MRGLRPVREPGWFVEGEMETWDQETGQWRELEMKTSNVPSASDHRLRVLSLNIMKERVNLDNRMSPLPPSQKLENFEKSEALPRIPPHHADWEQYLGVKRPCAKNSKQLQWDNELCGLVEQLLPIGTRCCHCLLSLPSWTERRSRTI